MSRHDRHSPPRPTRARRAPWRSNVTAKPPVSAPRNEAADDDRSSLRTKLRHLSRVPGGGRGVPGGRGRQSDRRTRRRRPCVSGAEVSQEV